MSSPARIVHIAWLSRVGGGELFLVDLLRALSRRGLEQELLCVGPGGELLDEVRRIGVRALRFRKSTRAGLVTLARLALALRRSRPGLVQTHGETGVFWGIPAAILAGVPRLCALVYQNSPGPRHKMLVMRRLLPRADRVLAGSADVARFLSTEVGLDPGRIEIVPCGIDVDRFLAGSGGGARVGVPSRGGCEPGRGGDEHGRGGDEHGRVGDEHGRGGDGPGRVGGEAARGGAFSDEEGALVVTVGRLVEQKGHAVLLDAFGRLLESRPAARLRIVGDGELRDALAARARELGIDGRVEFTGTVHPTLGVLRDADLFVFPSLWEPQGLAVLEAFAAGVPVIASRTGGIVDMVEDGSTGLLVEPGDAAGLAAAMNGLLADPARVRTLVDAARERVRDFDVSRIARRYERLYGSLLGSEAPVRRGGADEVRGGGIPGGEVPGAELPGGTSRGSGVTAP